MDQTTQYRQLQPEDRMTMASMKQQGSSARAMARALGRSPSTITRELARNTLPTMPYGSHTAQVACFNRRVAARPAAKLAFDGLGWAVVRTLLDWKWSPPQLIGLGVSMLGMVAGSLLPPWIGRPTPHANIHQALHHRAAAETHHQPERPHRH